MTIEELNEIFYLRKEIRRDKDRIAEAEAQAMSTVGNYGGIGGSTSISDKVGNGAIRLAVLTSVLNDHLEKLIEEERKLLLYIQTVRVSYVRTIMKMRFVDGMEWYKIAMELNQGGESTVRNAVVRYLEKENEETSPK